MSYDIIYRGVNLNEDPYNITRIDGLEDVKVRRGDRDYPLSHGQIPGRHLASGKTITIYVDVIGDVGAQTYIDDVERLRRFMSPDQGASDAAEPGSGEWLRYSIRGDSDEKRIRVRPINSKIPLRISNQFGVQDTILQFYATDPRIYSSTEMYASNYIGGSRVDLFKVTNSGYSKAYPVLFLQNPEIKDTTDDDPQPAVGDRTTQRTIFVANVKPGIPPDSLTTKEARDNWIKRTWFNSTRKTRLRSTVDRANLTASGDLICWLELNDLQNPSAYNYSTNANEPSDIPAYMIADRGFLDPANWDGTSRTATEWNPRGQRPIEQAAASMIYTCHMDKYIRGQYGLIIYRDRIRYNIPRNAAPGTWNDAGVTVTASADKPQVINVDRDSRRGASESVYTVKQSSNILSNEYAKWSLPREPFFLLPGDNWIVCFARQNVEMIWRGTSI